MSGDLAGVLDRRGGAGRRDLDAVARALGPTSEGHHDGPLTVGWTGEAAVDSGRAAVFAGARYAGPAPAAMLGAGAPPQALRGDFALLLWDGRQGMVARDQLGQRGLFWHDDGARLTFATEVVLLLALLPRRPGPDASGLAHWIGVSGLPGEVTLFEGVRKLEAGQALPLDPAGPRPARRWWRPPPVADTVDHGPAGNAAALRVALTGAVDRRVSDPATTAVLLSGGLDSSSVAAIGRRELPAPRRPRRAYSATFPDHPSVDETALIGRTCDALGLAGTRAVVRSGSVLAGALPYVERWALPPVSPNLFFWLPLLERASADGTAVLLDGEGGDELFGLSPYLVADRLARGRLLDAVALAGRVPGAPLRPDPAHLRLFLRTFGVSALAPPGLHAASRGVRDPARYVPPWMRASLARAFLDVADGAAWKREPGPRWRRWLLWAVASGMGPGLLYDHVRHRGTMCGVEARHPLVDVDVVELMLRLPPEQAFDRERSRPILRGAVAGLLPDEVRLRPDKSTFDAVFHEALAGPDRHVAAAFLGPDARVGEFVDLAQVRRTLVEAPAPAGARPRMMWALHLWRLLTAECWLRAQEDDRAPRALAERAGLPVADCVLEGPG